MLIVLVHNDGTGTNDSANYQYEVRVNQTTIFLGHLEGHNRDDGWSTLLREIADQHDLIEDAGGHTDGRLYETKTRKLKGKE